MSTPLTYTDTIDRLEAELQRLDRAVRATNSSAPCPSCPDWNAVDLYAHLGAIHRWATAIVDTAATRFVPIPDRGPDHPDSESSAAEWADWLAVGGAGVVAALRAADPEASVWSWRPGITNAWWARRQLHETGVHRADVEITSGLPWNYDPRSAIDAIEEYFDNLAATAVFNPRIDELTGDGSLHLHATDEPGEWTVQLEEAGFAITRLHGKATVAAKGGAADLLGVVTGRIEPSAVEVFGDGDLLVWWLERTAR